MAMKKKFLGLALATAIALPASSVYAADSTTIHFNDTTAYDHSVSVSGNITKKDGSAAVGKIQVELPTAMSFTVDQKGNFTGCDFTVKNQSEVGIDVSVKEFRKSNGNINLETKEFNVLEKDRSHVSLVLNGRDGGKVTEADLANIAKSGEETKILNVDAQSSGLIKLTGKAGTKEATASPAARAQAEAEAVGVDKDGASGDFTLVFKIEKDSKN